MTNKLILEANDLLFKIHEPAKFRPKVFPL